MKMLNKV